MIPVNEISKERLEALRQIAIKNIESFANTPFDPNNVGHVDSLDFMMASMIKMELDFMHPQELLKKKV